MTTTAPPVDRPRAAWRVMLTVESLVYAVVFLVALGLRAIQLGSTPLNEAEARQAMAAWHLVSPHAPGAGTVESPLIFAAAALTFALSGASNAGGRLLPMLGGTLLVFVPLAFRHRLGRGPMLIASAFLALSPVAIGASRQMSGTGLAMLTLALMLAAVDRWLDGHKPHWAVLAGIALGAALLADYGTPLALISLALGLAFAVFTDEEGLLTPLALRSAIAAFPWRTFFTALLGAVILPATLFFAAPQGLGAAADQLARLVNGLAHPTPGAAYLGVVLLFYHPVLLLFGGIGAWQASQSEQPWQRLLAGWGIAALIVSLIYRGAQPEHALWSVLPLAALAGLAVADLPAQQHDAPRWSPWGVAAAFVALLGMIFASLSQWLEAPHLFTIPMEAAPDEALFAVPLELALTALWGILLVLLWLTAASMWGSRIAWRGVALGVLLVGALISAGQGASLAFTRATSPFEPFHVAPAQPVLDDLVATASQIGNWATGFPYSASLSIQADPNGALAWALRDFTGATYVVRADPRVRSIMVITPADGSDPALGSSYVGQDFTIQKAWTPQGLQAKDLLRWLFYRSAPTPPAEERVILWVREDIYRLQRSEIEGPWAIIGGSRGEVLSVQACII